MTQSSAHSIQSARSRFFNRGELPIDSVGQPILRSWLRCQELGLDQNRPPQIDPPDRAELRYLCERYDRLRLLCRPELDALNAEAHETGGIVILTNAEGTVLDAVGDTTFAGRAAAVALRPGVAWSEGSTGTNAIGTAIAERRAVAVHGSEHFFETHKVLSCAAVPITDPRGVVVGVLDLSTHADVQPVHALGLVRLAVEQIEYRFFAHGFEDCTVLHFHNDQAVLGAPREGIMVFDESDRLVAANRRGLSFVRRDWSALDMLRFDEVFERLLPATEAPFELTATDGSRFFGAVRRPFAKSGSSSTRSSAPDLRAGKPAAGEQTLRDGELQMMRAAIDDCGGNISEAARRLGIHRSTLYRRVFDTNGPPRSELKRNCSTAVL